MAHQTFMIEPIFGEPGSLTRGGQAYHPWDDREVKGWRDVVSGETKEHIHEFAIGAMWFAVWYPRNFQWDDESGPHLIVRTPGGDWDIDGRASNCTLPNDKRHRCWVRHGEPPMVTVGKNGVTCQAGAGSIAIGSYHGFLQNGCFT